MDRFFLVYRVSEAHQKAALERQQPQYHQQHQEKNTSETNKKTESQTDNKKEQREKQRFENDFSEWVYKMINC